MTKNQTPKRLCTLLLTTLALVGCGRSEADREAFERAMREGEAQANAAATAAAARLAEPAPVTLTDVTVAEMGVALKIPEGARPLQSRAASTTYSLPLGGIHEINVQVMGFSESSLEAAQRTATQLGGTVQEANERDGGFEIVLAPRGVLQTVHAFAAGKSVKCTGPRDRLPVLREICGSLRPAA